MSTLEDHGVTTAIKPSREGWRYMQEHLGRLWRIPETGSAPTGAKLVEMVVAFRAAAGLPPGDAVADVADYIKKASPLNDRFKGRVIGAPRVREITPLIYDLRQWVDNVASAKPRFVFADEAQSRALVCLKCPQNVRWEVGGCGACNTEVHNRSYLLRKGKETQGEEALLGCRLHRVHLPAAVHLDRDFLPTKLAGAPAPCWLPLPATNPQNEQTAEA